MASLKPTAVLLCAVAAAVAAATPCGAEDARADSLIDVWSDADVAPSAAVMDDETAARTSSRTESVVAASLVHGYRRSARLSLSPVSSLQLAAVWASPSRASGFAQLRNAGGLRRMVVGGISARAGNGVVLGARSDNFSFRSPASVARGIEIAPSSSSWLGRMGAGVECSLSRWTVSTVAWRGPGADRCVLGSVGRGGGRVEVGTMAGVVRAGVAGAANAIASLFASWSDGASGASAELGAVGRSLALGAAFRRSDGWSGEWFRAPPASSYGAIIPEAGSGRSLEGIIVRRRVATPTARGSASLSMIRRSGRLDPRKRYRFEARGQRASAPGTWDVRLRITATETATIPPAYVPTVGARDDIADMECRCRFDTGGVVRERLQVTVTRDADTGRSGALFLWQASIQHRWARVRVSLYRSALSSQRSAYVSTAYLGGYDTVDRVSGARTAATVSADVNPGKRIRISGFARVSEEGPVRAYVALAVTL